MADEKIFYLTINKLENYCVLQNWVFAYQLKLIKKIFL